MKLQDQVEWTDWYPSGDEQVRGTLGELLECIVSRQPRKRLPPYRVLEDIVQRGRIGGGMDGGLQWSPDRIVLDGLLYDEFRASLPLEQIVESSGLDLASSEEWRAWCFDRDYGLDYAEHLRYLVALRKSEVAKEQRDDDQTTAAYQRTLSDYMDFVSRNLGSA